MKFLDVGQHAEGFIAIGQEATGFFALGQIATGVIAIGQAARGVIALGQVSIGLVSGGMLTFGLISGYGLGVGGRAGWGLVLPLVPAPRARPQLPARSSLAEIRSTRRPGWLDVVIHTGASGRPELTYHDRPLDAVLSKKLRRGAVTHSKLGGQALAHVVPERSGLRVTRLMANPGAKAFNPAIAAIQIVLLGILAGAYWETTLVPLGDVLVQMIRDVASGAR